MASFCKRLVRAIRLDRELYEEVAAERDATRQAVSVVVLAALAGVVGMSGRGGPGMVAGVLVALGGWVIAALIIFVVGTRLLPQPRTRSNPGELLRALGFANAPGLLYVLAVIPSLGRPVRLAVSLWLLIAWVTAVRQALDYDNTGRAVLVCVIGWLIYLGGILMLSLLMSGMTALVG